MCLQPDAQVRTAHPRAYEEGRSLEELSELLIHYFSGKVLDLYLFKLPESSGRAGHVSGTTSFRLSWL